MEAERTYWLDLFTPKTWREFVASGGTVSGFRASRRPYVRRIHAGDYLLCYLTGVSRFVGILEVVSELFEDDAHIWSEEIFPLRFRVKKVAELSVEHGVPIKELLPRFSWFQTMKSTNSWQGYVQGSPRGFVKQDGEMITEAILGAVADPVARRYDPRLLLRAANRKKLSSAERSPVLAPSGPRVPARSEGPALVEPTPAETDVMEVEDEDRASVADTRAHTEIEALLLRLGSAMSLDLWVDAHDRNRIADGVRLGDIPGVLDGLASQFSRPLGKDASRIDVLWFRDDEIIAAFEVESTTSIYSGLLRMSDLLILHPNVSVPLFIVAPEDKRDRVGRQIIRPTFTRGLRTPLWKSCRYISFEKLRAWSETIFSMGLASILAKAPDEALNSIAESFDPAGATAATGSR